MTKKKKSGYDYLKERVAELEERNVQLVLRITDATIENAKRLRCEDSLRQELKDARKNLQEHISHYHWLYKHAPFWLKWWYCKHFFGK